MGSQRVRHNWAYMHRDVLGITVREGAASTIPQSTEQLFTAGNGVAQTLRVKVQRPWRYLDIVLLCSCTLVIPFSFSLGACTLPVHFLLRLVDRWGFSKTLLFTRWPIKFLFVLEECLCALIVGSDELPCQPRSLTTHDACTTRKKKSVVFLLWK